MPVTLPPGRARLATKPASDRIDLACVITMGIVLVAFLGRTDCWSHHPLTMISTLRRTSSAASSGRRSSFPSAYRYSMTMFLPFYVAKLAQTLPECLGAGGLQSWIGSR